MFIRQGNREVICSQSKKDLDVRGLRALRNKLACFETKTKIEIPFSERDSQAAISYRRTGLKLIKLFVILH